VNSLSPDNIAAAFKSACLAELEALKPGNVHIFSDGHGMVVQDFVRSAEAAAGPIAQKDASVGGRIQQAIEATWAAVGCNTNLGIVLLCAPLAQAALHDGAGTLRERLQDVLAGLTVRDAEQAYLGIQQASPAGLGESAAHDVRDVPRVTLLEAMLSAAPRDFIASQYASGFDQIFSAAALYQRMYKRWGWAAWATTAVYLDFLSRWPDTHLVRKFGPKMAAEIMQAAERHNAMLQLQENPKVYQRSLLDFDRELKQRGLNPGTSADLTVASLFVAELEKMG
jgi:triphosphoribosyl-dephospho-CoA synthase